MRRPFVLFLFCLAMPATIFAQLPPPPAPQQPSVGGGKWWKNSPTVRALDLSETQIAHLEAVYLQHQARLAELRTEVLQNEEGMRNLLTAEWLDERAIAAQKQALSATRASLEAEYTEMALAMRRLMTAEQWRKLEEIRQSRSAVPPLPAPPLPTGRDSGSSGEKTYDMKTPGLQEPELLSRRMPPYTPEARAAKIEGTIILQALFRKDGTFGEVKVLRGLGYGLDESAASTLKTQWRFRPALLDGQPVNVRANIEITFRLF